MLHDEELHNLHSFPDIIRQIKSRRIRSAGHVETTQKTQGLDGRMVSEWILLLGRLAGKVWIGFDWLKIGTGGELL
jgi:hypothetical protein